MVNRFLFIWIAMGVALQGCSRAMLVRSPQSRVYTDPSFESSRPFFFMGLVGPDQHVYVDQICLGKGVDQVSTAYTAEDFVTTLFTLGIYSPRTVRVWCRL